MGVHFFCSQARREIDERRQHKTKDQWNGNIVEQYLNQDTRIFGTGCSTGCYPHDCRVGDEPPVTLSSHVFFLLNPDHTR